MGAGSAADESNGGLLVVTASVVLSQVNHSAGHQSQSQARGKDWEGSPVARTSGPCMLRNVGDQCAELPGPAFFMALQKLISSLQIFLIPASDWWRLRAPRDLLDASTAHLCS